MKNGLQTRTHLFGYIVGLVAALGGALGPHINSTAATHTASTPLILGGLGTVALSVVFKLFADLGISQSTIETDWDNAKKILESFDAVKPELDKLPLFEGLMTRVDGLDKEIDAKVEVAKEAVEAEINKIPVTDRATIVAIITEILQKGTATPPAA